MLRFWIFSKLFCRIIYLNTITVIYLLNYKLQVNGQAYRGGSIHWRPISVTDSKKTIEIIYRLTWDKSVGGLAIPDKANFCTKSPFLTENGDEGDFRDFLICNSGCNGLRTILQNECKETNDIDNWVTAQGRFNYTLPKNQNRFELGFEGCCWANEAQNVSSTNKVEKVNKPWTLLTGGKLSLRDDLKNDLNNPPIPINSPYLKLERGCLHKIKLHNYDEDGDEVRCRLNTDIYKSHCGNSCQSIGPDIELDELTCELRVDARNDKINSGHYPIDVIMEDFIPNAITILSRRPVVNPTAANHNYLFRDKPLSLTTVQMTIDLYDSLSLNGAGDQHECPPSISTLEESLATFSTNPSETAAALSDYDPLIGVANNFDSSAALPPSKKSKRAGIIYVQQPQQNIQQLQQQPTSFQFQSQAQNGFGGGGGSQIPASVVNNIPPAPVPQQFQPIIPPISNSGRPTIAGAATSTGSTNNDECIELPISITFQGTIYVRSPTPSYQVQNVFTVAPTGLSSSPVFKVSDNPPLFGQNVTWNPSSNQKGPNSFCFFAVNTVGQRSATSCLTLYVTDTSNVNGTACGKRPQVVCTNNGLEVFLLVDDPKFNNGIFYVKNHFKKPGCQLMLPPNGPTEARLRIPLGACGLELNPETMRYETIVVLQPHSMLVTNMARAYHVVCQPAQTMVEIPVKNKVDIDMITTQGTLRQTHMPPMPTMLFTDENGQPLSRASLGQKIRIGIFLPNQHYDMRVKSCTARALERTWQSELIDSRGCPTDPNIFPQFEAVSRGALVSNFPAFKFPDSEFIQMECSVTVCWKQCPPRLNPVCGFPIPNNFPIVQQQPGFSFLRQQPQQSVPVAQGRQQIVSFPVKSINGGTGQAFSNLPINAQPYGKPIYSVGGGQIAGKSYIPSSINQQKLVYYDSQGQGSQLSQQGVPPAGSYPQQQQPGTQDVVVYADGAVNGNLRYNEFPGSHSSNLQPQQPQAGGGQQNVFVVGPNGLQPSGESQARGQQPLVIPNDGRTIAIIPSSGGYIIEDASRARRKTSQQAIALPLVRNLIKDDEDPSSVKIVDGLDKDEYSIEGENIRPPFYKYVGIRDPTDVKSEFETAIKKAALDATKFHHDRRPNGDSNGGGEDDTQAVYRFSNEDENEDKLIGSGGVVIGRKNKTQSNTSTYKLEKKVKTNQQENVDAKPTPRVLTKRTITTTNELNDYKITTTVTTPSSKLKVDGKNVDESTTAADTRKIMVASKYLRVYVNNKDQNPDTTPDLDDNVNGTTAGANYASDQQFVFEEGQQLGFASAGIPLNGDEDLVATRMTIETLKRKVPGVCLGLTSRGNKVNPRVSKFKTLAFLFSGIMSLSSIFLAAASFAYYKKVCSRYDTSQSFNPGDLPSKKASKPSSFHQTTSSSSHSLDSRDDRPSKSYSETSSVASIIS